MTVREIISKFEKDNKVLADENKKLKAELHRVRVEKNAIDMELKSLKRVLNTNVCIIEPEEIKPTYVNAEVICPNGKVYPAEPEIGEIVVPECDEVKIEEVKPKRTRKKKIEE